MTNDREAPCKSLAAAVLSPGLTCLLVLTRRVLKRSQDRLGEAGRVLAAAAIYLFVGAHSSMSTAEPVEIRVGYGATPAVMLGLVFEKSGVMKHYGKTYTVKRMFFPASSQEIQAFAANQLDVGFLAFASLALAVQNAGAKVTVWGGGLQECVPNTYTQTWAVQKNSQIRAVADLKGKRIAVPAFGTGTDGGLRVFLKSNNIDPEKDVEIVEVNWPNQDAMLQQGKVDAAVYLANFWDAAMKRGDVRPLFTFCPATGFVQTLVQVVRSDFLSANRAAMADFVEDYVRGVQWFEDKKNRAEAIKLLAKFSKQPEKNFEGWAFSEKDEPQASWAMPNMQALQANIDQFQRLGLIPRPFKAVDYTDLSMVQDAKKRIETER
jgi:sulfonate transport system substrate-binding protein